MLSTIDATSLVTIDKKFSKDTFFPLKPRPQSNENRCSTSISF